MGRTAPGDAFFGRDLPAGPPIGESWEIVDRPEAQSRVRGGRFGGVTLRELMRAPRQRAHGPEMGRARPFPLLVKWLDCSERLSLQVHPPAEVAAVPGRRAEDRELVCRPLGARRLALRRPEARRDAARRSRRRVAAGTAEDCVNKVSVASGDSVLVHSGQVHAIDAGNLILEIQQNSDTTYRLYDWGRVGARRKAAQAPRRGVAALDPVERRGRPSWSGPPPPPARSPRATNSRSGAWCSARASRLRFRAGEQPRIAQRRRRRAGPAGARTPRGPFALGRQRAGPLVGGCRIRRAGALDRARDRGFA